MSTDADRISTAWQMLGHLGITLADLQASIEWRPIMPTFADYLPRVTVAASPGTHRTYGTYWQRMQAVWGDRRLDDIIATLGSAVPAVVGGTPASCSSPQHAPSTTGP